MPFQIKENSCLLTLPIGIAVNALFTLWPAFAVQPPFDRACSWAGTKNYNSCVSCCTKNINACKSQSQTCEKLCEALSLKCLEDRAPCQNSCIRIEKICDESCGTDKVCGQACENAKFVCVAECVDGVEECKKASFDFGNPVGIAKGVTECQTACKDAQQLCQTSYSVTCHEFCEKLPGAQNKME